MLSVSAEITFRAAVAVFSGSVPKVLARFAKALRLKSSCAGSNIGRLSLAGGVIDVCRRRNAGASRNRFRQPEHSIRIGS
jgi:hypothetical protein